MTFFLDNNPTINSPRQRITSLFFYTKSCQNTLVLKPKMSSCRNLKILRIQIIILSIFYVPIKWCRIHERYELSFYSKHPLKSRIFPATILLSCVPLFNTLYRFDISIPKSNPNSAVNATTSIMMQLIQYFCVISYICPISSMITFRWYSQDLVILLNNFAKFALRERMGKKIYRNTSNIFWM